MKKLVYFTILICSTTSWAQFNKVQKFEVKANHSVYDGYEQDGDIFLYAPVGQQRLSPGDVINSLSVLNGIRPKDRVLLSGKSCIVDALFENGDVYIACDEKPKGTLTLSQQNLKNYYLTQIAQIEKDVSSLELITKNLLPRPQEFILNEESK